MKSRPGARTSRPSAAIFAGLLAAGGGGLRRTALPMRRPPAPRLPRPADLLLDGLTARYTEGYRAAVPILGRALEAFGRAGRGEELRA